jgi:hypothetical protein
MKQKITGLNSAEKITIMKQPPETWVMRADPTPTLLKQVVVFGGRKQEGHSKRVVSKRVVSKRVVSKRVVSKRVVSKRVVSKRVVSKRVVSKL